MRRLAHAVVVAGILLGTARASADQGWVTNQIAHNFTLTGLPPPVALTSPWLLGNMPVGPCAIQTDASRVASCITPLTFADPFAVVSSALTLKIDSTLHLTGGLLGVSGLGALTPSLPLAISGSNLVLNYGASFALSGSNLQRSALTGAITAGQDINVTAFGSAAGLSLLGVPGSSAAVPTYFSATANNQVAQMLSGSLQFHTLDFSQLTGTVGGSSFPALTGAVTTAGGTLATAFGAAGPHSVLAVGGGSSAVPTFIGPATAGQVFMADPSTTALGWEIPPLVTLSNPGYMSAGDKLKVNGGVTPTVTTDLLRYGDLQTCTGIIQWTGTALGCAPALGFLAPLAVVAGNLILNHDASLTVTGGNLSVVAGAATVRADGIATGTVQLASIAAGSMADGTIAYVDSVGDFFALVQSALTTTATTVVTASGKSGYQWHRMNVPNAAWQVQATWYVDPLAAVHACSDEATGLTSSAPLCTMAEVARRTAGAAYPISGTACVVYLESSKPTTDIANFQYSVTAAATSTLNPGGFDAPFMIIGVPTDLGFSGVVSSAQNGALGSTQDIHFTDTGIPTSFTASGFLATNVVFYKTSGTPGYFFPALDLGSKTLRASQINTGFGTYTTFTNGDTYRVLSLPNFNATTFPAVDAEFPTAAIFGVAVSDASGKDPATTNPGRHVVRGLISEPPAARRMVRQRSIHRTAVF